MNCVLCVGHSVEICYGLWSVGECCIHVAAAPRPRSGCDTPELYSNKHLIYIQTSRCVAVYVK
jgi:hypothetical protein